MQPQNFQIDNHADLLIVEGDGDGDDLITSKDLARWLRVSLSWVEKSRAENYGPPFIRMTTHSIRYSRKAVLAWLAQRAHTHDAKLYGEAGEVDAKPPKVGTA